MTQSTRCRRGIVLGLVVVLLVGLAVGMLTALQRRLIYFPDSTAVLPAGRVIDGADDVTLHTSDGLELSAWFVPPRPASDTHLAVLVAPGNGGNRSARVGLATGLSRRGFAVLLMDYRGYGGNPGSPTEEGLARDALAAALALEGLGYPAERTIYFGESLGSGVVAALQARRPPAGLVLRSPFTDLAAVGAHHYPWLPVRLLLKDRFPVLGPALRERGAGDGDLRGSGLGRSRRAERPCGGRGGIARRTSGDRGRRSQRRGHVRAARGGRGGAASGRSCVTARARIAPGAVRAHRHQDARAVVSRRPRRPRTTPTPAPVPRLRSAVPGSG